MNATQNEIESKGLTLTDDSYIILYGDHDSGSDSKGFMVREGIETAKRTEKLMWECGYRRVEVKSATDLLWG